MSFACLKNLRRFQGRLGIVVKINFVGGCFQVFLMTSYDNSYQCSIYIDYGLKFEVEEIRQQQYSQQYLCIITVCVCKRQVGLGQIRLEQVLDCFVGFQIGIHFYFLGIIGIIVMSFQFVRLAKYLQGQFVQKFTTQNQLYRKLKLLFLVFENAFQFVSAPNGFSVPSYIYIFFSSFRVLYLFLSLNIFIRGYKKNSIIEFQMVVVVNIYILVCGGIYFCLDITCSWHSLYKPHENFTRAKGTRSQNYV
eukprot:TRINITY_DN57451_c0_g1_i11.p2 TRINITY_DN57451_c0_g1~~TRINITY_DN57451_c0_g1_i11.p2  ORF type:complete len:249 (-),score=-3.19 TRINITY_DN57451_c0_g1_i11:144-890(-)